MKKKKAAIDDLARMVQKGFAETAETLERIENLLIAEHRRRIERLEVEMKEVVRILAIK
jgi:ABC-type uncharacterized transport system ATPase component